MNPTASTIDPAADAAPHSATSRVFVVSMIGLSATLVLGMVSLVFYRSQSVVEPTAAVFVTGDASLDGAQVSVAGGDKPPISVSLNALNQFQTPILLQPGMYEIQVSLSDKTLFRDRFAARNLRYITYSLPTALVVQGDATMAGAVVQVVSDHEMTSSTVLDLDNGFSAVSYHLPGKLHIVVAHDSRVIRDQSLVIAAHKPRRVSLLAPIDVTHFPDENQ